MVTSDHLSIKEVSVVLRDNDMRAELHLKPGANVALVTEELCRIRLESEGVILTPAILADITSAVETYQKDPTQPVTVTVLGRTPVAGKDGYLQWGRGFNPQHLHGGVDEEHHTIDFYQRISYVVVQPGECFLNVIPPAPGQSGVDVKGKMVEGKPGKEVEIAFGEGVDARSDGQCVANLTGILMYQGNKVWVDPSLHITEYVDFGTGNIDFDGNIVIDKGVRDCFIVKVTGHAVVHGLIEAATMDVGGDLQALGGMASKEKGHANVGGNLLARYLDNVHVMVHGDLTLEREAVNCEMEISGKINIPHGSLIGGVCHVAGESQLATLGSPSGAATILHIGSLPRHESVLKSVLDMLDRLQGEIDRLTDKLKQLEQTGGRRNAQYQEAMTELMFRQSNLRGRHTDLDNRRIALQQRMAEQTSPQLHVEKMVHFNTTLICRKQAATFDQDLPGPVVIAWDQATHGLVYRDSDGKTKTLATLAHIHPA
ncbi:MAG: DUF342 domain-containing protein [Phycisphaeraceae bacterium]|nr:DUF342 domain-containing protein [Phycisphaeraceae bacterium]